MPDKDKHKIDKPSGRVRHDPGGRAVWQWAIDSGKHAIESTSRLLKRLDLTHLQILDYDEIERREKEAQALQQQRENEKNIPTFGGERAVDPLAGKQRGFNPYDSRTPIGRGAVPSRPKTPPKPRVTQPVRPPKKPGLLARLFGADKG